jgi:DNA polymerase-4
VALRRILHVDMDAFYASVAQRDDPSLRGRPVAVGGSASERGVVMAASYEARAFGVRSATPTARALRLCRELVVVPPDFTRYRAVSQQVLALFRAVTPLVEPLSLDEAFLDVTENAWGEALGVEVARRLKAQIKETTELTASAGVAPNKLLAKIASGWKKPDGLTVVAPERVDAFLAKLPVDALWGVGPKTAARLKEIRIERVVDLRTCDLAALAKVVGSFAPELVKQAHGVDERPVVPDRASKSVGNETTFVEDVLDLEALRSEAEEMARRDAAWLLRHELRARTVTLKLRYRGFVTVTRSETRRPATCDADELAARAAALLFRTEAGSRPVRLIGVSLHNLEGAPRETVEGQLPLLSG